MGLLLTALLQSITLASNYSDIGHIVFKEGELSAKAIELFRELVDFGLIQFRGARVTRGAAWPGAA